ncbi:MAG: hypothetical protein ABSH56_35625 [Bryobacteraceae bacterium]
MEVVKDKPDTSVPKHIPGDTLERLVMNRLSESELEPVEEHLLVCRSCQDRLEAKDEFVKAMKAAMAEFTRSGEAHENGDGPTLVVDAQSTRGGMWVHRKWLVRF